MNKSDFIKLVGGGDHVDYAPVAGMLESGYGFAGFYNTALNEGLEDSCVLLNARLVDLRSDSSSRSHPQIADFNEFVEEIVQQSYPSVDEPKMPRKDVYGKSIPLAAIPFSQISIVYPVGHIGKMMKDLQRRENFKLPGFLDFDNKSLILKVLRTKLW